MSKDAITTAKAKEQNEWRTKSIAGAVQSVDPATGTLTIKARSGEGRIWTVAVGKSVGMLRYSDDSVRFADAKPAAVSDVHVGDQMRILGDKDEAAGTVAASRIIFGSFRTLGGEITAVDLEKSQVTIRDVQTRKLVVLRNAIHHSPAGTAVEVRLYARNGRTVIEVRDFGPGVPAYLLERIFHPFVRAEQDSARDSGGVGLDLSIARRAVELHHGCVTAANAHPGLVVTIEL